MAISLDLGEALSAASNATTGSNNPGGFSFGFGVPSPGDFAQGVLGGAATSGLPGAFAGGMGSFFNPTFSQPTFTLDGVEYSQAGGQSTNGFSFGGPGSDGGSGQQSPYVGGMTILDDGTQVNAQGVAISGPRAGQRFIPGTQQAVSQDGRQDPRFDMLGPTNTGFSPQNPNQPISFGGNTLAPLTVQTPAGTVSRDAQGNFGFDSGIGELRSKRAAAFAAAADDIDKQAQQYDTAPPNSSPNEAV